MSQKYKKIAENYRDTNTLANGTGVYPSKFSGVCERIA